MKSNILLDEQVSTIMNRNIVNSDVHNMYLIKIFMLECEKKKW